MFLLLKGCNVIVALLCRSDFPAAFIWLYGKKVEGRSVQMSHNITSSFLCLNDLSSNYSSVITASESVFIWLCICIINTFTMCNYKWVVCMCFFFVCACVRVCVWCLFDSYLYNLCLTAHLKHLCKHNLLMCVFTVRLHVRVWMCVCVIQCQCAAESHNAPLYWPL